VPPFDAEKLANELHDGVIQELSALLLQLETCKRYMEKDPAQASAEVERIMKQVRLSLQGVRALISRLRSSGP
jgi:signal transduction histidine kinase